MHALSEDQLNSWKRFTPGPIQVIAKEEDECNLAILRLDLLQSWASGNKYYKLKQTIAHALSQNVNTLVSKGGMFSNHLDALGEAASAFNMHLVAIIRSYGPDDQNPTIARLISKGAEIIYLSPEAYKEFDQESSDRLFPGAFFIPEGGLSDEGILGASEITDELILHNPTHVILAGGSMGTACGILSSMPSSGHVIIVPAWKGCTNTYFSSVLRTFNIQSNCTWELWTDYHFGGFGKFDQKLIDFMTRFSEETGIPLDPVYTGKLMYAIEAKRLESYFQKSDSIIAIHTGGLQGLEGYKYRFPVEWGNYLK